MIADMHATMIIIIAYVPQTSVIRPTLYLSALGAPLICVALSASYINLQIQNDTYLYTCILYIVLKDCGHEKTPLHYAIERRDVALVQRLLHLAMNSVLDRDLCSVAKMLEAKTGNGNTALHLAASVDMDTPEHKKLIQQLMSKGADPSSKNSDGFLPRELTKNRAVSSSKEPRRNFSAPPALTSLSSWLSLVSSSLRTGKNLGFRKSV